MKTLTLILDALVLEASFSVSLSKFFLNKKKYFAKKYVYHLYNTF